jgi:hypothetical protein
MGDGLGPLCSLPANPLQVPREEDPGKNPWFQWKLNPTKCVFGVPQGKLLGFIISHRGIEANSEKINAIIAMDAPRKINDV